MIEQFSAVSSIPLGFFAFIGKSAFRIRVTVSIPSLQRICPIGLRPCNLSNIAVQGEMLEQVACISCGFDFLESAQLCPHCARPSLFPNVSAANKPMEVESLMVRYEQAKAYAESRGAEDARRRFQDAASKSNAIISRSLNELQRLVSGDNQVYATYYELTNSGVQLPTGGRWDLIRTLVDEMLFGTYKDKIRFAALSLNKTGLTTYGECSLVLKDTMIAHRASVFEENSCVWLHKQDIKLSTANSLPKGFRASWNNRGLLSVAKLGNKLIANMSDAAFESLLLEQGTNTGNDNFIEVHIYGPLTVRSLAFVRISKQSKRSKDIICRSILEKLGQYNVPVEII
jgi:hypothetical protein